MTELRFGKRNKILFWAGLCIVILSLFPYFILGEGAAVPYHDQLDGELLAYIYQAKYLFSGQNVIPEFMNGAVKTALLPPAPLAVLLFRALPPFAALITLQALGQFCAYTGMFCLAEKLTDRKPIALIAALLYAFLPFLPVYGLSQYGMPLLLLCAYCLYQGIHVKKSLLYVAFYGAMSSLVLCGFAVLAVWAAGLAALAIRKKIRKWGKLTAGFAVLLGVYAAENLPLLVQMLGIGEQTVSHKSEYVLTGDGFLAAFWNYFRYNGEHSADGHLWIAVLSVVILVGLLPFLKKCPAFFRRTWQYMAIVLGVICALCLTAALWDSAPGIAVREHMGTMGAFQLSRVLWIAPLLWLTELIFILDILWSAGAWRKWLGVGVSVICLGAAFCVTMKSSLVKPCLQQLLRPDYPAITYEDYYALGVMEQAEELIAARDGLEKEAYRVASLGIDPAAALYHGFYCVDGYSNNYDVEYKHAFRRVIAPELEKSDYLREYYDDWGNRCYLFSSECPGYYTVEKGGFFFRELALDTKALKELGCDYIFSAAFIANADEEGLVLLSEEGLETPESYYRIYIYKIAAG